MRRLFALLLLISWLWCFNSFANPTGLTNAVVEYAGDSVTAPRFSLITVGPGSEVYLLEGHSALRVVYPDGRDLTVNWGMFDFADPAFPLKFARGETDYWVSAEPTDRFLYAYGTTGRYLNEQPLNLSPEQARRLASLVEENLLPQNRVYRYRYLTDNCATRPLDLIEQAINDCGDSLAFTTPSVDTTWRKELQAYHKEHPLYQLFIDIALGAGIDRPINPREQAFAPVFLHSLAADSRIISPVGSSVPLVSGSTQLIPALPGVAGSEPSPAWIVIPVSLLTALTVVTQLRRRRLVKWANALIFALLSIPAVIVTFLVFFSSQEATGSNINLLWLNPLCLAMPLLVWSRATRRILRPVMWINLLLTAAYILGLPFFNQSTGWWLPLLALCDLALSASFIILSRHNKSNQ